MNDIKDEVSQSGKTAISDNFYTSCKKRVTIAGTELQYVVTAVVPQLERVFLSHNESYTPFIVLCFNYIFFILTFSLKFMKLLLNCPFFFILSVLYFSILLFAISLHFSSPFSFHMPFVRSSVLSKLTPQKRSTIYSPLTL
jgi:hypothetical protein